MLMFPQNQTCVHKAYTVQDVAEIFKVTPKTITAWMRRDRIRGVKIGHVIRIPQSEVDRLLKVRAEI